MDLAVLPDNLESAKEAFGQLRAAGEEFGEFVFLQLDELDAMRAEVQQRQQELIAAQRLLSRQQHDLHEQRRQVEQLRVDVEGSVGLHRQLADLQQEKAILQGELKSARDKIGRLADASIELADARNELAQVRAKLLEQRQPSHPDRTQHDELTARVLSLDKERDILEAELEAVRRRTVELAEQIAHQSRQTDAERAQWLEEIKRLRCAVEQRAPLRPSIATSDIAVAIAPTRAVSKITPAAAAQNDPVLDSVKAQFEMVQRDIARRRSAG